MQVQTKFVEISVAAKFMRTLIAQPVKEGKYPGILLFTDIFQLSESLIRTCVRLAGYGYVVAAHEMFHRLEPAGTVFAQNDEGRARAMQDQQMMTLENFDEDTRAAIDYLKNYPNVLAENIGVVGFCIGGHLAFRAAFNSDIKAAVCFYPTWLHNGKLGAGQNADSLQRAAEIRGKLLVIFGTLDSLIPVEGREAIIEKLKTAGVNFTTKLFAADHGFMRDDRAAHDPQCSDQVFGEAMRWFNAILT